MLRLVESADVILTNVRPGGLKRAGLDHDTLLARFPKLIYASVTGYGLDGPDADRPGWTLRRSGRARVSRRCFAPRAAIRCSCAQLSAITSPRWRRWRGFSRRCTNARAQAKGGWWKSSLLRMAHYAGGSDFAIQHTRGRIASNRPRKDAPNPLINYFKTSDQRWITLLTRQGEGDWLKLARALKLEHLVADERFARAGGGGRTARRWWSCWTRRSAR